MVKNPPATAGLQVRSLVWEDPTCCVATAAPQLLKPSALGVSLQQEKPPHQKPLHHNSRAPHSPQLEEAHKHQPKPSTAKRYILFFKKRTETLDKSELLMLVVTRQNILVGVC